MHWINVVLYVFLGILGVAYIYILVADNEKTSITFGRKKRVIFILLFLVKRKTSLAGKKRRIWKDRIRQIYSYTIVGV